MIWITPALARQVDRQARAVAAWNAAHPVGSVVLAWVGPSVSIRVRTIAPAELLNGHTAIVRLDGVAEIVPLTRVRP